MLEYHSMALGNDVGSASPTLATSEIGLADQPQESKTRQV